MPCSGGSLGILIPWRGAYLPALVLFLGPTRSYRFVPDPARLERDSTPRCRLSQLKYECDTLMPSEEKIKFELFRALRELGGYVWVEVVNREIVVS